MARSAGVVLIKRLIFLNEPPAASRLPPLTREGSSLFSTFVGQSLAAHETAARIGSDIVQVAQVSRVSKQIEVHDFDALLRLQDISHEARTDESGAARN